MKNIFDKTICQQQIDRIQKLTPQSSAAWGKMSVDQMLAHLNVSYEMVYESIHPKPNTFVCFILKTFIKNKIVGEQPFPKNSKTAPQFVIKEAKNFEKEQQRLIAYISKTQALGKSHFEGKESHSFGKLTTNQWNNLLYKHLDHHLTQFNV